MLEWARVEMDELITTKMAAELLGVGTTSIKRWSDEGKLPAFKTAGGHRRYRRADVERLLQRKAHEEEIQQELHTRLPSLSRAEIDALPVGVIQIDDNGVVVLYSATEARFSGIPVERAEGKHFFKQLAPCTDNSIMLRPFYTGLRTGELDFRIDYTFTYRMRPTLVALHFYRDPNTGTNWLIVDPRP